MQNIDFVENAWPPGPAWCRSSRGYWSATRLEALDPQGEGVDGPWESIVGVFYNDEAFNMVGRRLNACDSVSVLAMRFSHSLCCVSLGRVLRGAHRITEFGAATRRHIVPSLSQAFEVLKKLKSKKNLLRFALRGTQRYQKSQFRTQI